MRVTGVAVLALCSVAAVAAQNVPPRFDVASVKPSSDAANPDGTITVRPGAFLNGRFVAMNGNLLDFIRLAFASADYAAIDGAPEWMTRARFDVDARASETTPAPQLALMLRTLLVERFAMSTHVQTRLVKVYGLVLARTDARLGPKMQPTSRACTTTPRPPGCGINFDSVNGAVRLRIGALPMEALVDRLRASTQAPVLDHTGLRGLFDVELTYSASNATLDVAPDVFGAVQEQLGLRLVEQKAERDVLIIDQIERPSEN